MEVRAANSDVDLSGATVIAGVMEGLEALPGSELVDEIDPDLLRAAGFEGKTGQIVKVPHSEAAALLLIGLGGEVSFDSIRSASGDAARKVNTERAVTLLAQASVEGATRAVVEGSILGAYQFRTYKSDDEDALDLVDIDVVGADGSSLEAAVITSTATALARDWVNTPARDKAPQQFAKLIENAATEAGVGAEVWDRQRIEKERLGAILGVAVGSDRDPRLVQLVYSPAEASKHLVLVGKGITFDSGGLSLKSASAMEEMKDDMSGAAVVAAATIAIAKLGLTIKVTCITPITDNAVGGDATRPGDVLTPVAGPTIEVLNTDAEGRLILADGLGLAKALEPDLIVDVATLTGAAVVALGQKIAAVFGSDSDVSTQILKAASIAGEEFWEMPLFKGYRKSIDSNIADIQNISGTRYGGAIVAAIFLAEYAGEGAWAHLDIAGPARARETSGDQVKGASGVGVRTLVELARDMAETD